MVTPAAMMRLVKRLYKKLFRDEPAAPDDPPAGRPALLSMSTLARRNSSIHKVREFNLPKINLEAEYEVVAVLQEGWRGRLLLVEHRLTRNEVVLKATHKDATSRIDFFREFHYNYYLSPHRNILNAFDVAFTAGDFYMFAQELAPFGDLTSNTSDTGIGETNTKKIACQIASALDFMHSKDLVHRDINMDNILVFKSDFSRVKLCDFGSTRKTGCLLKKKTVWLPYAPPEIVDAVQNEGYHVDTAQDVWQFGILIYVLLTGQLPWQKADLTDPHYAEYSNWRKRKTLRTPKRLSNFSARFLRWMKKTLEPKPEKRASVKEVMKYMDDKWLIRQMKRDDDVDNQSICYSTFSMHSSKIEKDKVLKALKDHGIETTVDRAAKRKRIHEWLERSISSRTSNIEEDDLATHSVPIITDQSRGKLSRNNIHSSPVSKSTNASSLNNLLDDGYQTGSSSNNSSMKMVQLRSSLNKSTGTINNINIESESRSGELCFSRKTDRQKKSSNKKQLENSTDPTVGPSKKLLQRLGHSPARPVARDNHLLSTRSSKQNLVVQPQPGQITHSTHPPDPNVHGVKNYYNFQGDEIHKSQTEKNNRVEPSHLNFLLEQRLSSQARYQHSANLNSEHTYYSSHTRRERNENFEIQRSRTDSFYDTESSQTPLMRQESDEGLSDSSVNSVILRLNTVGA